jgi:hypothetical protein
VAPTGVWGDGGRPDSFVPEQVSYGWPLWCQEAKVWVRICIGDRGPGLLMKEFVKWLLHAVQGEALVFCG